MSSSDVLRSDASSSMRQPVLVLLVVFAALYLPWLAVEPPVIGLETTRIEVAREMTRSADWIIPTQNGARYLAKPPVGYWLIALGSLPFGGVGVVSARLVSALCMLALALCVAQFARREIDVRTGLLAGLCVLGTALCVEKGMRAELEASLALFTSLSILGAFRAAWSEHGAIPWTLAAGASLGAATLIKGPVALLIFALAAAGAVIGTRTRRARTLAVFACAGLVALLLGGAWLLALYAHGGGATDFQKLVDETFKRVKDAGITNREPWWYYAPALLVSFLPATMLLPALVVRGSPARAGDDRRRSLFALLMGWSVAALAVLSCFSGKEARYLIATLPGWSILAAWAWWRADAPEWLSAWRRTLVRAGTVLVWVAPAAIALAGWRMRPSAWTAMALAAGLAILALVAFERGRKLRSPNVMWCALVLEILALRVFWAGVPMANRSEHYPIERMGADIAARLAPGQPLVQVGEYDSYVQLQIDRPIRVAWTPAEIEAAAALDPRTPFVLARTRYLAPGDEGTLIEVASWPFGSDRFRLFRTR